MMPNMPMTAGPVSTGLHLMRHGWACHCTNGSADNCTGRSCHSTDASTHSRATDALFRGCARRGCKAEQDNESELLHETPPKSGRHHGSARGVRGSTGASILFGETDPVRRPRMHCNEDKEMSPHEWKQL
jgi:hypothetical protein